MNWSAFIKKLISFDVFWGRRSKIFHGIKDGGALADTINDEGIARKVNGATIFNVNHVSNEALGGHFHDFTEILEHEALYYRNMNCTALDVVGDWVRITAPDTVSKLTNNATTTVLGVITSKSSSTKCQVAHHGRVDIFSGLDPTKERYFLSTSGGLTSTPPMTGSVIELGKPVNSTTLLIGIKIPLKRS